MITMTNGLNGNPNLVVWTKVTANDCDPIYLSPGTYNFEVFGTWGTGVVKLAASLVNRVPSVPLKNQVGDDWVTSADVGIQKIVELSSCWVKPILSGSGYDLTIVISKAEG